MAPSPDTDSTSRADPFGARRPLAAAGADHYALTALEGIAPALSSAPVTLRILLENALRHAGRGIVTAEDVERLAGWRPGAPKPAGEIPFLPARVLLQDYTGVPAVVDLAALRDALAEAGADPTIVKPAVRVDLVIDHSVQVDAARSPNAFEINVAREYERNAERYRLLRWAQQAFPGLRVVPPGTGIVHQVNLEYLARVVRIESDGAGPVAFPDTLVGTDSHTTMVNGLGVLGYGVGGIEAEAVILGMALPSPVPRVVGVRLVGELPAGSTATDLVLAVTERLRRFGVVGAFVEFCGPGVGLLSVADRATVANMAPEYGATAALFPIDRETLAYLRLTGRPPDLVALVERYAKEQGIWREADAEPEFDDLVEVDLASVGPAVAGPRRPQDRVALAALGRSFGEAFPPSDGPVGAPRNGRPDEALVRDGSIVIAAITSCTNTSNPALMVAAGLLARNAVARGLRVPASVKTSLAPGSRAVTDYLARLGLMEPLETLGFHLVGYGCTTCIGNSGPLDETVARAIESGGLATVAVLSGNRNFEGRIHPLVRASYLASPPLVVALALAGRIDLDPTGEPLAHDREGRPVFLDELWPAPRDVAEALVGALDARLYTDAYANVFGGDERWRTLDVPGGTRFAWDPASTYVARPPFAVAGSLEIATDIVGARVLALLGDSVTTDHISPAGAIAPWSPAGRWLVERGVSPGDFNSYGSRRGHHEVMARGTFANVRLRNLLLDRDEGPDEGPWTIHQPSGERMLIYDAAVRYAAEEVPLVVIAGREYGSGSSRDWAAKGPLLLGVRAVLAESFERIHRSNLVGMGILPLRFDPGEGAAALGLSGRERFSIEGLAEALARDRRVTVRADDGASSRTFAARVMIEGASELATYRAGGILPLVLGRLLERSKVPPGS